jgi:O-antigen/teichoic acid export membrane protein
MVTTNWTATSVVRFGVREFIDTGRIAGVFWTRSLIVVVNLLIIIATSPLWLRPLTAAMRVPSGLAPLLLLHLTASVIWYHMQQSLMAAKLPKVSATLLTLERVVIVVALLVMVALRIASLRTVIAAYIVAPFFCIAIASVILRRMILPWTRIESARVREMLRFSAPLLPTAFVSYFSSSYLDSFLIARFMDAAAVGVYAVGYQFAGASMMLIVLAGSLLQPFFVSVAPEMQEQRIRLYATRVLPVITLGWTLATVIGAAIGGPLLVAVFGARYTAVAPVLWPMMASLALSGPSVAGYFPIAYTMNRTHILAINAIVGAPLNIVLDIVLIPRYGLVGCAWGTVLTYIVCMIVVTALSDRAMSARTWWNAISTLPAITAALVALWYGSLAAIGAALVVTAMIVTMRRAEVGEGTTILLRVLRWRRA